MIKAYREEGCGYRWAREAAEDRAARDEAGSPRWSPPFL